MLCHPSRLNNRHVINIYKEVAKLTPTKDKGIQTTDNLYEINGTKCVTIYLECEFHDNEDTEKWIDEHEKELGRAIAKGVCDADGKVSFAELTGIKKMYKVQVGAFHNRKNAEKLKKELSDKGYNCYIAEG